MEATGGRVARRLRGRPSPGSRGGERGWTRSALGVERVLSNYARFPYAYEDIQRQTVFDRAGDHYLLMSVGWDGHRVHGCLVHIDLIDGKLWIQHDGTESGIARDLEAAGISRDRIVLAFRPPEIRAHTGYAVA